MPPRSRAPSEPPRLDRPAIVRGALDLIDRDGFDAFSLRRLARHLGVGNMSLYWYVADRDELLTLVLDDVIGSVDLDDLPDDPGDAIGELASRFAAAFKRHPQTVPLFALAPVERIGARSMAVFDHAIGLLRRLGLSDDDIARATFALFEVLAGHLVGHLTDLTSDAADGRAALDARLHGLPPDALPHYRSLEAAFRSGAANPDPAFAVRLMVDGLRARVRRE